MSLHPEDCERKEEHPWKGRMPSQLHEVLLQLFRNRPLLAPELLREALHVELPKFSEARIDSADLTVRPLGSRPCRVLYVRTVTRVIGWPLGVNAGRTDSAQPII